MGRISILSWIAYFLVVVSAVTDEQYASMPKLFDVDDYDTCMMMGRKSFYCVLTYKLAPLNVENPPEVWNIIKESSSSELHYRHDLLRRFVCIPQTCPKVQVYNESHPDFLRDLTECFDEKYRNMELHGSIEEVNCKTSDPVYEIDTVDVMTAIVVQIAGATIVCIIIPYCIGRTYPNSLSHLKITRLTRQANKFQILLIRAEPYKLAEYLWGGFIGIPAGPIFLTFPNLPLPFYWLPNCNTRQFE